MCHCDNDRAARVSTSDSAVGVPIAEHSPPVGSRDDSTRQANDRRGGRRDGSMSVSATGDEHGARDNTDEPEIPHRRKSLGAVLAIHS
jgi:hypothetical protein